VRAVLVATVAGTVLASTVTGASMAYAERPQFEVVNGSLRPATGEPTPTSGLEAALLSNDTVAVTTVEGSGQLQLGAIATACEGWPTVRAEVDGISSADITIVDGHNYGTYEIGPPVGPGRHSVSVRLLDDRYQDGCDRNVYLGYLTVGPPDPDESAARPAGEAGPAGEGQPLPTPAAPPADGRPGPSNTGVPEGTPLQVHQGDLTVTTDGAVIDGLDIRGFLTVQADDVTVRRSIIRGRNPGRTEMSLVAAYGEHRGLTIEDTTLLPSVATPYLDGIKGSNFTASRLDVSGVVDNAVVFGDNVAITDSWFHRPSYFTPWPAQPDNQTHNDNVQIEGGRNITIARNTFEDAHNAAVMITQNYARSSDILITGNQLSGGGCTINLSEKGRGPIGATVIGNRFGPSRYAGCAVIAPDSSVPVMRDNTFTGTGAPVLPTRGG
jgi:hypothetical protein